MEKSRNLSEGQKAKKGILGAIVIVAFVFIAAIIYSKLEKEERYKKSIPQQHEKLQSSLSANTYFTSRRELRTFKRYVEPFPDSLNKYKPLIDSLESALPGLLKIEEANMEKDIRDQVVKEMREKYPDFRYEEVTTLNSRAPGDMILAYNLVTDEVKKRLKNPSSAEFAGSFTKMDHVSLNRGVYTVDSYVDAKNALGVKIRTRFKAKITIKIDKSAYTLTSIEIK